MTEQEMYNAEWIAEVAKSACLRLREDELQGLAATVGAELSALSELCEDGELGLSGEALDVELLREDLVGACLDAEQLVSAASCRRETYFSVSGVLEEGGASS